MHGDNGLLRVVAPADGERAVDEANDAPSPGRFLREQRKRRGMTIEQLAAATKIPRRSLEMLEDDRYDALPGPVFVKGFLRCAARALGVDVQTVMDLLYERERAALSARRGGRAGVPATPDEASPIRRTAPRLRARSGARGGVVAQLRARMPSPAVFLWVVVAAFVAMVVLAAFNLVGSATGNPT
jgi:cytoskeletal protein RodZ